MATEGNAKLRNDIFTNQAVGFEVRDMNLEGVVPILVDGNKAGNIAKLLGIDGHHSIVESARSCFGKGTEGSHGIVKDGRLNSLCEEFLISLGRIKHMIGLWA